MEGLIWNHPEQGGWVGEYSYLVEEEALVVGTGLTEKLMVAGWRGVLPVEQVEYGWWVGYSLVKWVWLPLEQSWSAYRVVVVAALSLC